MCLRCQTLPTYQPTYLYESKPDVEALFTMQSDSIASLFVLKPSNTKPPYINKLHYCTNQRKNIKKKMLFQKLNLRKYYTIAYFSFFGQQM
jgi:hypothetical protein